MVTKKQHYVPQLLLRRFATLEGKVWRTQIYDIERQKQRNGQNIKDVCSENFMYDVDNTVERLLDQHIETPAGTSIVNLLSDPANASLIPDEALLRFLMVQIARTRRAFGDQLKFVNSMMRTVFETFAALNNRDLDEVKNLSIVPTDPRQVLSHLTLYASTQHRLLSDLRVALVINETSQEFVLADHPVFQHNWYLRGCNAPQSQGLSMRGLQLFFPLSPQVTYCLYDNSVYAYQGSADSAIVRASTSDVRILNSFQAINAESSLVAKSAHMATELESIGRRYAAVSAFVSRAKATAPLRISDGTLRSQHWTWREPIVLPAMPSFIKVKNKVRRRPVECMPRRPT